MARTIGGTPGSGHCRPWTPSQRFMEENRKPLTRVAPGKFPWAHLAFFVEWRLNFHKFFSSAIFFFKGSESWRDGQVLGHRAEAWRPLSTSRVTKWKRKGGSAEGRPRRATGRFPRVIWSTPNHVLRWVTVRASGTAWPLDTFPAAQGVSVSFGKDNQRGDAGRMGPDLTE